MLKFTLNRLGLKYIEQFRKPLQEIVSNYHWVKIAAPDIQSK